MAGTLTFGAKVTKKDIDVKDDTQPDYLQQVVSTRKSPVEKSNGVLTASTTQKHYVTNGIPLILTYGIDNVSSYKVHAMRLATVDATNFTAGAGFFRVLENNQQL